VGSLGAQKRQLWQNARPLGSRKIRAWLSPDRHRCCEPDLPHRPGRPGWWGCGGCWTPHRCTTRWRPWTRSRCWARPSGGCSRRPRRRWRLSCGGAGQRPGLCRPGQAADRRGRPGGTRGAGGRAPGTPTRCWSSSGAARCRRRWPRPRGWWRRCWARTWSKAQRAVPDRPQGRRRPGGLHRRPDARHGHKTSARGFDGYKGHVSVDPDSELVMATAATAGNAGDAAAAPGLLAELVAQVHGDPPAPTTGSAARSGSEAARPPSTATAPMAPGRCWPACTPPASTHGSRSKLRSRPAGTSPRTSSGSTLWRAPSPARPGAPPRSSPTPIPATATTARPASVRRVRAARFVASAPARRLAAPSPSPPMRPSWRLLVPARPTRPGRRLPRDPAEGGAQAGPPGPPSPRRSPGAGPWPC
jgi:hypothetical protein